MGKPEPKLKKPVGDLIQAAIDSLKQEICEKADVQPDRDDDDEEKVCATIEAIAERLRNTRRGKDLLQHQSDFVNFAFRNSTLLRLKWLEVVDLVRYGSQSTVVSSDAQAPAPSSQHPTLSLLCQEFGFCCDTPVQSSSAGMPDRAAEIERRLTNLGFQHYPDPTADHGEFNEIANPQPNTKERPESTTMMTTTSLPESVDGRRSHAVDDMVLGVSSRQASAQTAQDLHRLIYELKVVHLVTMGNALFRDSIVLHHL